MFFRTSREVYEYTLSRFIHNFENPFKTATVSDVAAGWRQSQSNEKAAEPRVRWPRYVPYCNPEPPPQIVNDTSLLVTNIGHASVLLQTCGVNIITDPVLFLRTGPFATLGPRRVIPAGIAAEHLPPIHVVCLSHDHYDHLCKPSLRFIADRNPATIFTGKGMSRHLHRDSFFNMYTLNWWEEVRFDHSLIQFTPARHWSGRLGPFGFTNSTLWGSFLIKTPKHTVYFGGDSGYDSHYKEIGELCREEGRSIDVALLPIGACEPRWMMRKVHMNPADAVQAHIDLGAKVSIPLHYDVFNLGWENYGSMEHQIGESLSINNLPLNSFCFLAPGEQRTVDCTI